jgi:putative ABC transport system permease protein
MSLILKNLLRRRVRTGLSVLGISIGIAAIIAFNAIGQGFKQGLNQYMRESGAQLLVVNRTVQDPAFSRVTREEQDYIRGLPEVEHLSRGTFTIASPRGLKVKAGMPALLVFGRTPGERLLDKYRRRLKGRLIEGDGEIMLGSIAAQNLGLGPGDSLEIFGRAFAVTGIYESGVSFENVGACLTNAVVQAQLKMGEAIAMGFVYLKDPSTWTAVKAAAEKRYEHLSVIRTEEFGGFYNQLEYIDWFVWTISLVSVAVGGLGVLNTMLMSVSERTREIGTLRAVGWSRGMVLQLILSEGVAISAAGGVLGLGIGAAGAELLVRWGPRGFMDTRYSPELFGLAVLIAVALGFAGALYPAWQAGRLSPIEALKYE